MKRYICSKCNIELNITYKSSHEKSKKHLLNTCNTENYNTIKENTIKENTIKNDIDTYILNLEKKIEKIMTRKPGNKFTFDILDTKKTIKNKEIILKEKQRQMKIGEIWQEAIGSYYNFENLKNNHKSGLDIISYNKKIIIELKNRTNTDNSSSKKS